MNTSDPNSEADDGPHDTSANGNDSQGLAPPSPDSTLPIEVKSWPSGVALSSGEIRDAQCLNCGTAWRVHRSMAGFRLRCGCGAWVDVPPELPIRADGGHLQPVELPPPALATVPDAKGLLSLTLEPGETYEAVVPTSLPMAPGTLQAANVVTRARWTNAGILEVFAVLMAIALPQWCIDWFSTGQEEYVLLPVASFVSAVVIIMIAFLAGPYGTIGLRKAPLMRWLEGIAVVPLLYGFACVWVMLLRVAWGPERPIEDAMTNELVHQIGLGWTLMVIAVCPAVVEEIAFRGMLQGRLMALLGARTGIVVVAMAFTLVHVSPATIPVHFLAGLYLGWLRERSVSLLPGMLVHFLYNASIVLFFK